ncbi:hypothetical protein FACS1894167_06460 [Synergistales bacterium]|nr:hypothetical protein FACS1894167_06460 [Synergistales bacterium]
MSKDALLGREGDGFRIAMTSLDGARISAGAIAPGMSEAALNVSRSFARERSAFGATIAELRAVQFKIFASSHAVKSAPEAIQIHGARGYSNDYPAEQLLRDAKMPEIGEGANEVLRMIIGRTILA